MVPAASADDLGKVRPRRDTASTTGFDHAGQGGESAGTFRRAGTVTDPAGNDPVAQSALGLVVGQRQRRVIEHRPKGVAIVEQLARQRAGFLMGVITVSPALGQERVEHR